MISNDELSLLYVEPKNPKLEPTIEYELTAKMRAWMKVAKEGPHYHGVHTNADGYSSASCDYFLPTGHRTHSLCVHYLSNHRSEIPESEFDKVRCLPMPGYKVEDYVSKDKTKPIGFTGCKPVDREIFKYAIGVVNVNIARTTLSKADRKAKVALVKQKWNGIITKNKRPPETSIATLEQDVINTELVMDR